MVKYENLLTVKGVLVFVPVLQKLKRIDKCDFKKNGKNIIIPAFYKNGMPVRSLIESSKKIILNRNFFGLDPKDFGSKITATVAVIDKVTKDNNRTFTMLDVVKEKNQKSHNAKLKFTSDFSSGSSIEPPVQILNSSIYILFSKV